MVAALTVGVRTAVAALAIIVKTAETKERAAVVNMKGVTEVLAVTVELAVATAVEVAVRTARVEPL